MTGLKDFGIDVNEDYSANANLSIEDNMLLVTFECSTSHFAMDLEQAKRMHKGIGEGIKQLEKINVSKVN